MNDELDNFKKKYRAHVQQGQMRFATHKRMTMQDLARIDYSFDTAYEYEQSVQIDMSKHDFDTMIGMEDYFNRQLEERGGWSHLGGRARLIVEQHEQELRIRSENPAAKIAYEKYQTILKMVESHYK
jgi:hypothetical protein